MPDADETYNVEISLKRVAILYSCHNLNQWGLFESLFKDIEDCQGGIGNCCIPVTVS
jgi:cohesin complex subunit SA-1/2